MHTRFIHINHAIGVLVFMGVVFFSQWGGTQLIAQPTYTTGMDATFVIGQTNFTSSAQPSPPTASSLQSIYDVRIDLATGKVFVADYNNNRVLRYSSVEAFKNGGVAEFVFGQPNFTSNTPGVAANRLTRPNGLWIDDAGNLWVVDYSNNRVLRFNNASTQTTFDVGASLVLGQTNFTSSSFNSPSTSATTLRSPLKVLVVGTTVFVSDAANNRVLRYDNPTTNGAAASQVFGQADFSSTATNRGGSIGSNTMSSPSGLAMIGNSLFVSEEGNHRVIRFDNATTLGDGPNAHGVLGQASLTTNGVARATAGGFNFPFGLAADAQGNLWVTGGLHHRVLRFNNAVSKADNASADIVLGQPTTTTFNAGSTSINTMNYPVGIALNSNGNLFVAEFLNARVTVFGPVPTSATFSVSALSLGTSLVNGSASTATALLTINNCSANQQFTYSTGGAGVFSVSGNFTTSASATSFSTTVTITLTPGATAGSFSGVLWVNGNGITGTLASLTLSASVVSTTSLTITTSTLNFGSVNVGSSSTQTIRLTINNAQAGERFSYSTSNTIFTLGNNVGFTTTATSTQFSTSVTLTFSPTNAGAQTGTFTISTASSIGTPTTIALSGSGVESGTALTVSASTLNYSTVNVGSSSTQTFTLTIRNAQAGERFTFASNSAEFSLGNNVGFTTSANSTQFTTTLTISFAPTSTGNKTASLTISTASSVSQTSIALSGVAVSTSMSVSVSTLNFGTLNTNTSSSQSVTLTINNVQAGERFTFASNSGEFSLGNNLGFTTNANSTQFTTTMTISFAPTSVGNKTANLTISTASSVSQTSIALSGVAVSTSMSVSVSTLNFGTLNTNASSSQTVTLTINNVQAGERFTFASNSAEFSLGNNLGFTTSANSTQFTTTITISFTPISAGNRTANLTISTASSVAQTTLALSGLGILPTPVVSSWSPNPVIAGTVLTITGNNLLQMRDVVLGGVSLSVVSSTATQLIVNIPSGITGTQTLTLTNIDSRSTTAVLTMAVPGITTGVSSLSLGTMLIGGTTSASFTVSATSMLTGLSVIAPTGILVSLSPTSGFSSTLSIPATNFTVSTTVFVRFAPSASVEGNLGSIVFLHSQTVRSEVSLSGRAVAIPVLSFLNPETFAPILSVSLGSVPFGGSSTQTVMLRAQNALENVVVSVLAPLQISLNVLDGYAQQVIVSPSMIQAGSGSVPVYMRMNGQVGATPTTPIAFASMLSATTQISGVVTTTSTLAITGRTVNIGPVIRSLSPRVVEPGSSVTLTGVQFGDITGATVSNGTRRALIVSASDNTAVVQIPAGLTEDSTSIRLLSPFGTAESPRVRLLYTPTVLGVFPVRIVLGSTVDITGNHFDNVTEVRAFGETGTVLPVELRSQTLLRVRLPQTLTTPRGQLFLRNTAGTVNTPEITIIFPTQAQFIGATTNASLATLSVGRALVGQQTTASMRILYRNPNRETELRLDGTSASRFTLSTTATGGFVSSLRLPLRESFDSVSVFVRLSGDSAQPGTVRDVQARVSAFDVSNAIALSSVTLNGQIQNLSFAPIISAITPRTSIFGGEVRIVGLGFTRLQRVALQYTSPTTQLVDNYPFAVRSNTAGTVGSDTLILAMPNVTAESRLRLQLVNNGGTTTSDEIVVFPLPVVRSIQTLRLFPGDTLTLSGNFLSTLTNARFSGNISTIGTANVPLISSTSNEQRSLVVPLNYSYLSDIQRSARDTARVDLFYTATASIRAPEVFILRPPQILRLPSNLMVPGNLIYASGRNLRFADSVRLFTRTGPVAFIVDRPDDDSIMIRLPEVFPSGTLPATTRMYLITRRGRFVDSSQIITRGTQSTATAVQPTAVAERDTVTITGTNLSLVNNAFLFSVTGPPMRILPGRTETQLRLLIPMGVERRTAPITLVTAFGPFNTPNVTVFGIPSVSNIQPRDGNARDTILLLGQNLLDVTDVLFDADGTGTVRGTVLTNSAARTDEILPVVVPDGITDLERFVTVRNPRAQAISEVSFMRRLAPPLPPTIEIDGTDGQGISELRVRINNSSQGGLPARYRLRLENMPQAISLESVANLIANDTVRFLRGENAVVRIIRLPSGSRVAVSVRAENLTGISAWTTVSFQTRENLTSSFVARPSWGPVTNFSNVPTNIVRTRSNQILGYQSFPITFAFRPPVPTGADPGLTITHYRFRMRYLLGQTWAFWQSNQIDSIQQKNGNGVVGFISFSALRRETRLSVPDNYFSSRPDVGGNPTFYTLSSIKQRIVNGEITRIVTSTGEDITARLRNIEFPRGYDRNVTGTVYRFGNVRGYYDDGGLFATTLALDGDSTFTLTREEVERMNYRVTMPMFRNFINRGAILLPLYEDRGNVRKVFIRTDTLYFDAGQAGLRRDKDWRGRDISVLSGIPAVISEMMSFDPYRFETLYRWGGSLPTSEEIRASGLKTSPVGDASRISGGATQRFSVTAVSRSSNGVERVSVSADTLLDVGNGLVEYYDFNRNTPPFLGWFTPISIVDRDNNSILIEHQRPWYDYNYAQIEYEVYRTANGRINSPSIDTRVLTFDSRNPNTQVSTVRFRVGGLTQGTKYYVRLRALNSLNTPTEWATSAVDSTTSNRPGAPALLTARPRRGGGATLSWVSLFGTGGPPLRFRYQVIRSDREFSPNTPTLETINTSVDMPTLSSDTLYKFRVQAENLSGLSDWARSSDFILLDPRVQDSTALMEMYTDLSGATWRTQGNWRTRLPLEQWDGIRIRDNRVSEIILPNNNMMGTLRTTTLTKLSELRVLSLWNNGITNFNTGGSGVNSVGRVVYDNNLQQLRILELDKNRLSTSVFNIDWRTIRNLRVLRLDDNRIGGRIPDAIFFNTNLAVLNLGGNNFQKDGASNFSAIAAMPNLRGLWLNNNAFDGGLDFTPRSLTSLQSVFINQNRLTTMPDFTANRSLLHLNAQFNRLTTQQVNVNSSLANRDTLTYIIAPQNTSLVQNGAHDDFGQMPLRPIAGLDDEVLSTTMKMQIFPQPVRDVVTVEILAPESGAGLLVLVDLTGKEVLRTHVSWTKAIPLRSVVDVSALANGSYRLILRTVLAGSSWNEMQPLVIQR